MSGEMNTSLANGWANLCIFSFIVEVVKGGKWDGYVEGDDGIFAASCEITSDDYAKLGFDVKVQCFETCAEASFCGIIAAPDNTLIKDPRRVFQSFGWTHSFIHAGEDIMLRLQRAKALSLLNEAPNCPIISELAWQIICKTRNVQPLFQEDGYHNVNTDERKIKKPKVTMAARDCFERVFNISQDTQIKVEELIVRGELDRIAEFVPPDNQMLFYEDTYISG